LLIIPAIDIKGGRCVRLSQGRMDSETVYSLDPCEVARGWEEAGAELIHLVDLDGAVEGETANIGVIEKIASSVSVPVQIGGGIRDVMTASRYIEQVGVSRVILGTAAHEDPALVGELTARYPGRVAVGIDARDGLVAIRGWVEVTSERAVDMARRFEDSGVACIIYTDISRDGMLSGPNVEATAEMAASVAIPVIASGGISSVSDIESYRDVPVEGIIIGKALYSGNVSLGEAIEAAGGV